MKKLMFYCVTLSFVAISGSLLIKSACEKAMINPIVLANAEAMAQDPWVNWINDGTCAAIAWTGDSWGSICNESKADVMDWYNNWNGTKYWCCDSCASTSWWASECGGK